MMQRMKGYIGSMIQRMKGYFGSKVVQVELPLEITADILTRLPIDSIVECKHVCKTWRTLIDNDIRFCFAQPFGFFTLLENQLRYGECYKKEEEEEEEEAHFFKLTKPLNYPPLPRHPCYKKGKLRTNWTILGSSNGLICLSACRFNVDERNIVTYNIYVYNPITREFVDVGTETHMAGVIGGGGSGGFRASGFGYHPSTNKYKVVRINYETNLSRSGQVRVYTLGSSGTSGWRDEGEIPYVITGVRKPGVLVNGALYWITQDKKILSFDLADEKFRIVSKPWEIDRGTRLGVLRGCLSAGISARHEYTDVLIKKKYTDVWIMNNNKLYSRSNNNNRTTDDDDDDDDEPSWTSLPSIEFNKPPYGYHIDHLDFNEISSYGLKYECFGRFLNFYSHLSRSGLIPELHLHNLVPYTKSCVSLKALGEENVKKIENNFWVEWKWPFWGRIEVTEFLDRILLFVRCSGWWWGFRYSFVGLTLSTAEINSAYEAT